MGFHTIPAAAVDAGEGHITILPPSYVSIGQGTWVLEYDTHFYTTWRLRNTSDGDGDNISYQVYLQAGTYTLLLATLTYNGAGIVDFDIDATEIASFDLYTAGVNYNVLKTQADISVATSGLYTLKARVHGKNGSSSNYFISLHYIALWRTA